MRGEELEPYFLEEATDGHLEHREEMDGRHPNA